MLQYNHAPLIMNTHLKVTFERSKVTEVIGQTAVSLTPGHILKRSEQGVTPGHILKGQSKVTLRNERFT